MHKTAYDVIDETIYQKTLPNGLSVYILPKQEMSKAFSIFMTNYGSIDNNFTPLGKEELLTVPDGIAHFLEHKLFEKEDHDVFQEFLGKGASPNAFTSFTKTAYLFSATKNMNENVTTLLDFVQAPYFSDESVEKEKGIIGQEINMYDDQADWQAFMGTIRNMFSKNPVHTDIAGTIESIEGITKEDLYTCYHTFYHPKNMVLFVIGNVDHEEMMHTIEDNQAQKDFPVLETIERSYPNEPEEVMKKESTIHMDVTIPKVTVGIKESNTSLDKELFLKNEVMQSLLLDYFFSPSGPYYEQLYEAELIDDSFEYSTTVEEAFSFSLISTNSNHPDETGEKIKELLLGASKDTLTEKELDTLKKKRIGQLLKAMNSLEFIANQFVHYHFMGIDFFKVIPYIEALTIEDVNTFLQDWIKEEQLTVCKIKP